MKLDEPRPNDKRFPAQGQGTQAGSEPVVVQVQLKAPLEAAAAPPAGVSNFLFRSPMDVDLSGFYETLRKHGLVKAEHSFRRLNRPSENAAPPAQTPQEGEKQKILDLHFPAGSDPQSIVSELRASPEVERAVIKPKPIPPQAFPADPLIGTNDLVSANQVNGIENEWYLFRCHTDQAWAQATGRNVIIADIDFGFLVTHQDLAANLDLAHAHNAYDGSTNVSTGDSVEHGTAVLGLAAAAANGLGIAGFAYEATLWPIQANAGAKARRSPAMRLRTQSIG